MIFIMISQVDICCGLAWGDEAKGKIVAELLRQKIRLGCTMERR